VGKGQQAAIDELDRVIEQIWEDIGNGTLKPYDTKDVILPP
jgi:hypothetical protein